jgi:hypothetical protein
MAGYWRRSGWKKARWLASGVRGKDDDMLVLGSTVEQGGGARWRSGERRRWRLRSVVKGERTGAARGERGAGRIGVELVRGES